MSAYDKIDYNQEEVKKMTGKKNNTDTFALFRDFNGKSLSPQAFKTFTN